jgi:hypothetical protein
MEKTRVLSFWEAQAENPNWRNDDRYVYCGRPMPQFGLNRPPQGDFLGDGFWGNPSKLPKNPTPEQAAKCKNDFLAHLRTHSNVVNEIHRLTGKVLVCWCHPKHWCHCEIYAEMANTGKYELLWYYDQEGAKPCAMTPEAIAIASGLGPLDPSINYHLGIFANPYPDLILDGKKSIESRWSVHRIAPYGVSKKGDIVFVKRSSGLVEGYFTMKGVKSPGLSGINAEQVAKIREQYQAELAITDPTFWQERAKDHYVTLIWIDQPTRCTPFAIEKIDRRSWIVLKKAEKKGSIKSRNLDQFLIGDEN